MDVLNLMCYRSHSRKLLKIFLAFWVLRGMLLERALALLEKVEETQRAILKGLKGAGYFRFSVPLLQKDACQDQVDIDIINAVKLPKSLPNNVLCVSKKLLYRICTRD